MVLSSSDRDDLVQRVARKLTRGSVRPDVIADAVDRTLGALAARTASSSPRATASSPRATASSPRATASSPTTPATAVLGERSHDAPDPGALGVAVVAAIGKPDLASRLRAALERAGTPVGALGTATEGRHTVVTLQWPAAAAAQGRAIAESIGARFSWRGDVR